MTAVYDKIMLFPHIRLTPKEAALLPDFFGSAYMLALEENQALPPYVKTVTPDAGVVQEVLRAYDDLKKLGDRMLKGDSSPKAYAGLEPESKPLYDKEAVTGILSNFRAKEDEAAGDTSEFLPEGFMTAALTLLLSEDMVSLNHEAQNVLKGADERSGAMWDELKGGQDPLQFQTRDLNLNLVDADFVKKRLAAWSVLAKTHKLEFEAYVTLDRHSFEQCLSVFNPGPPVKETAAGENMAVFYQLPISQSDFLNFMQNPDKEYRRDADAYTILGFAGFGA